MSGTEFTAKPVQVAIRRLAHGEDLPLPAYATADSAGLDLMAAVTEPLRIEPLGRAQVLQYQGKTDEAIVELTGCVDEARGREWTALEAFAIQNRGKVWFDTGDFENALSDMTAAVFLREKLGASPAEIQAALTAVAVVQSALDAHRGAAPASGDEGDTDRA